MAKTKALKPKRTLAKASDDYSPREAKGRFELAVDAAVATKPMHNVAKIPAQTQRRRKK